MDLVAPLQTILPCGLCRNHYIEFYAEMGPPQAGRVALWVYEMHKRVTRGLHIQDLEKVADRLSIARKTFLDRMLPTYDVLYRYPSFEVVQKRALIRFNDLIPRQDLGLILIAMLQVFDMSAIRASVLPWIRTVSTFAYKSELHKITETTDPLHEALVFLYGSDSQNSRYAASLMRAGSRI